MQQEPRFQIAGRADQHIAQRPLAQQTLKALLDRARYAPAHYRKAQREWLDEAHRELQNT